VGQIERCDRASWQHATRHRRRAAHHPEPAYWPL